MQPHTAQRPLLTTLALACILIFVACGERPLPADDGGQADSAPGTPGGCATNADCEAGRYCHLDQGCKVSGAKRGQCKPRPQGCDLLHDPVCGCDGKTHGNTCAAHAAGTNVLYKGACQSCAQLNNAYTKAVKQARTCCPHCNKWQCRSRVKSNLICPCWTYVEDTYTSGYATLKQVAQRFAQQGCTEMDCGMSCGKEPKGASCSGSGPTGACSDTY